MADAIYTRISDDRTGEELGIGRQRTECAPLTRGDALDFSDNDISATNGKHRPGYTALMAAVERGEVDRIIVWHTSRLWRNRLERAKGIELLQRHRVSVVPVKGPMLDMTTAYGRGMAGLVGEFDTMESEVKSERQQAKAAQLARNGQPGGGRRAFGYTADGLHLVDDEAAAVQRAYTALVTARRSLTKIAADLNAKHTTTMGGPWRHNSVRSMLLNARYAGIRAHKGTEYPAVWPAVVTEDVHRAAVAILREPQRRTNGVGGARKYLGTRLYLCGKGECGTAVVSTYREDGSRVYRCPVCSMSRRAEPVDARVEMVVEERLSAPDLADLLVVVQAPGVGLADLGTEAAALRVRQREAVELFKEGVLTKAEVTALRAELAEKLAAVERQFEDVGRVDPAAPVFLAADPVKAWRALDEVAQAQAVIRRLMTVTLAPTPPGVRKFDPASVLITRRGNRPQ